MAPTGKTVTPEQMRVANQFLFSLIKASKADADQSVSIFKQISAKDGYFRFSDEKKPLQIEFTKIDGRKTFVTRGLYPCSALIYLIDTSEGLYAYPVHMATASMLVTRNGNNFQQLNRMILDQAGKDLPDIRGVTLGFVPGLYVSLAEMKKTTDQIWVWIQDELSAREIAVEPNFYRCIPTRCGVSAKKFWRMVRGLEIEVTEEGAEMIVMDYDILDSSQLEGDHFLVPKSSSSGRAERRLAKKIGSFEAISKREKRSPKFIRLFLSIAHRKPEQLYQAIDLAIKQSVGFEEGVCGIRHKLTNSIENLCREHPEFIELFARRLASFINWEIEPDQHTISAASEIMNKLRWLCWVKHIQSFMQIVINEAVEQGMSRGLIDERLEACYEVADTNKEPNWTNSLTGRSIEIPGAEVDPYIVMKGYRKTDYFLLMGRRPNDELSLIGEVHASYDTKKGAIKLYIHINQHAGHGIGTRVMQWARDLVAVSGHEGIILYKVHASIDNLNFLLHCKKQGLLERVELIEANPKVDVGLLLWPEVADAWQEITEEQINVYEEWVAAASLRDRVLYIRGIVRGENSVGSKAQKSSSAGAVSVPTQIYADDLYELKLPEGCKWKIYKVRDSDIYHIEFATSELQDLAFKRYGWFQDGNEQRVWKDAKLKSKRSAPAYDSSNEGLARFYNIAQEEGVVLGDLEIELRDLFESLGMITINAGGRVYASDKPAAVITCAQDIGKVYGLHDRAFVINHELNHGLYFTNKTFHSVVTAVWHQFNDAQIDVIRGALAKFSDIYTDQDPQVFYGKEATAYLAGYKGPKDSGVEFSGSILGVQGLMPVDTDLIKRIGLFMREIFEAFITPLRRPKPSKFMPKRVLNAIDQAA